jgi:hypothetical protein
MLNGFRIVPMGLTRSCGSKVITGRVRSTRLKLRAIRLEKPGMRRTSTSVGVDTYRPLSPSPEFVQMSS